MTDMVRETPEQKLIRECEIIWKNAGLPTGSLRPAMQEIGDPADFANDPYRFSEYKLKLTAKGTQIQADEAAKCIYADPARRAAAIDRWNRLADDAGYAKHKAARGGLWIHALGKQVHEFKGTDESADVRIKDALTAWKAGQKPTSSALDQAFPRGADGQPLTDDPVEAAGDPEPDEAADEASDQADDPADDLEKAEDRRLDAADETLKSCEVCGGTILEGQCDTCQSRYDADGKRIVDQAAPTPDATTPPADPPRLTDEVVKEGSNQIWGLLKAAYPKEGKQQLVARYKDLSTFTSAADRIHSLWSVELALEEVRRYIAAHPADDPEEEPTGAPVDPDVASTGWDGASSGDLVLRAKALARTLRGPETDIRIQPERLADMAWKSGLYAGVTSFERAFMIVLEAIELGIPPTAGLKHIQVITAAVKDRDKRVIGHKTQTTQSIHLMLALVFASGELEDFTVKDGKVTVKRVGLSPAVAFYSATGNDAEKDIRRAIRYILRQEFDDVLTFGLRVQRDPAANQLAVADRGVAEL